MTTLIWLAALSLVWGAALWVAAILLQRHNDLSGLARQWIWRGAAMLLIAPWMSAPLVAAFEFGLAPPLPGAISNPPTLVNLSTPTESMMMQTAADPFPASAEPAIVSPQPSPPLINWSGIDLEGSLLLILLAGWIIRFVAAQLATRSLLGIVAMSRSADESLAAGLLKVWSQRLGLRRVPRLRIVAPSISPFSFGALRPTVCLPEGLGDRLGHEALNLVVGHECLHIARGDGWRRPLERIVADIFWFNPFAWAMCRELDMARELACDEGVVELSSARRAYARTLRDVAGLSAGLSPSAPAASMSLAGGGRSVVLRVTRTLALAKRKPARAALVAAVVLGLAGAPIAVAQVVLTTPRPHAFPEAPEEPEAPEVPKPAEPVEPFEIAPAPPAPEAPPAPVAPVDEPAAVAEPSTAVGVTPEPLISPLPPTPSAEPRVDVAPTPPPTPRAMPAPQQAPAPPASPEARAAGQAERKTELIALDGKRADRMRLRYAFNAGWVVDDQNILWRDDSRSHYLVTLKQACNFRRGFNFHPQNPWELRASRAYEVRPGAGKPCDVAKIERIDDARANALRDALQRRAW